MDSLLDALTNVVGILLLVLILTSINMNTAVRKILSEFDPVTMEELIENKQTREKRLEDQARLKVELAQRQSLEELTEKKKELAIELDDMELDESLEAMRDEISTLQALVEEQEAAKEENVVKVNDADTRHSELRALLADTPVPQGPPPEIVTLPDPRAAPVGAEPRYVICQNNKVYYIGDCYDHLLTARDLIDRNFSKLVHSGNGFGPYYHTFAGTRTNDRGQPETLTDREDRPLAKLRYDGAKVVKFFQDNPGFGGEDLGYRAEVPQGRDFVNLKILLRESGGMTVSEFRRRNSRLDEAYKRVQQERDPGAYLLYLVSPDSYQAYTEARLMSEFYNIPAGWVNWKGSEFEPAPTLARETTVYDFGRYIPTAEQEAAARALLGAAQTNADLAQLKQDAAETATTDPALKDLIRRWATPIRGNVANLQRLPEVAASFRTTREILIRPVAPAIPHVQVFVAAAAEPPDKVPPPSTRPPVKPTEPKRDTLD